MDPKDLKKDQNEKNFKTGDIIMRQGDRGDCAYVIESGRVEILLERPDGKKQSVGTRGAGTIIGEMSLVDNAPRTATVQAIEDCTMLEITQEDFSRRLQNADPVLRMTTQVILTRYRDTLTRADISGENRNWPPAEAIELNYAEEADAVEGIKLTNELSTALETNQLSLNYQPIIDLKSGRVRGFEALMRWEHPKRGFISPGIFIPIAEESGLIVNASQWALKEACEALRRMEGRIGQDSDLFMGVNFSSRDFASENFVDNVYNTISASDVKPQQLHIEITERMLMEQPDKAKETLEMCQKAGMSIAIDDFGTGYSSLSYLHYFPIDTLKIDQSFVRDMNKDDGTYELIKSIIALAKNMKMKTIAEGAETKEEAKELKELGCDMVQGYYFAKPMPEIDATSFASKDEAIEI